MKKTLTLLVITMIAAANIYSQTYTISFAAAGSATTLDSVKVENLTHPDIVKWYDGDLLQLVLTSGINERDENDKSLQVFPNPMQNQAEISFNAKQAGNATLTIYDVLGKEVLQSQEKLLPGVQKFKLTGIKPGAYFINISGDGYFSTTKLISQNATPGETKIQYLGYENQESLVIKLKSTKATINMPYTTGDNLRFTGYAGGLTATVTDMPTSSKTITFYYGTVTCGQPFTDYRDGTVYNSVQIGNQCWMTENLKYLPSVIVPDSGSSIRPFYYVFGYNGTVVTAAKATANYSTYGVLYNWPASMAGYASSTSNPSGVQGVCPTGWHLPSDAEWTQLTDYLGGEIVAGGKLKETGTTHWTSPNTGATDEYSFTALPGGYRDTDGTFYDVCYDTFFWTATRYSTYNSYYRTMTYDNSNAVKSNYSKRGGFSVRCVKD